MLKRPQIAPGRTSSPEHERDQNVAPGPRRSSRWLICASLRLRFSLVLIILACVQADDGAAQDEVPSLASIRKRRDAGDYQTAALQLLELNRQSRQDLSLDFVLLARQGNGHLDTDKLSTLYLQAFRSLESGQTTADNRPQRILIATACARHFCEQEQYEIATTMLLAALKTHLDSSEPPPSLEDIRPLIALTMQTGWAELNAGRAPNAESLYQKVVEILDASPPEESLRSNLPPAMLGFAWATASQRGRESVAAKRLGDYLNAYPESKDAVQAAALRINCLRQQEPAEDSELHQAIEEFCDRWPDHQLAAETLASALRQGRQSHPESLTTSLCEWINQTTTSGQWPAALVTDAMAYAGVNLPPNRFDELLKRLAAQDETGQHTAVLLARTSESDRPAIAEQVAATLISGDLNPTCPMAQESACRWAGRTGRWTLLALAAESTSPAANGNGDVAAPIRTAHVERLFAEALTQTGRGKLAYRWWSHLVDHRQAKDFATLLRCAETAVSHASTQEAQERVTLLQNFLSESSKANAETAIESVLADLLEADLFIRLLEFDPARSRLEKVVRSSATPPALRARAQWMIGETHFLQEQFPAAIDAYRQVEGLAPQSPYISAALVQAGKSFEQLGRTREAGVCYGTLLERFPESAHAFEAQRRMATLPTQKSADFPGTRPDAPTLTSPKSTRLRR